MPSKTTPAQKRRIKEEAGFKCAIPSCGNTSPLDLHHILDSQDGGSDSDDNLICLCRNCHGRYHDGVIPRESLINYKLRLQRISADLFQHEYNFLEKLFLDQIIELDIEGVNLARRLERREFVKITAKRDGMFKLTITRKGRDFIS